jgi:hypothetical protein
MAGEKFTRREVERAFRKFKDVVHDLMQADSHTWGDRLTHFMEHCEKNPVMQVVTEPLRKNTRVNGRKWYEDFMSDYRREGSATYRLPPDDEDCTALLYQFFYEAEYRSEEIHLLDFCYSAFGETEFDRQVYKLNKELVSKLTREIGYRLDEAYQDMGDAQEVDREAVTVFHYHDNKTTIQGGVYGGIVATGNASVSDSSAVYNDPAQLATAIGSLRESLHEVNEAQRETVGKAIDALAQAARLSNIPVAQVAKEAETVASASPGLRKCLADIAVKASGTLAASAFILLIKAALAAHGVHLP